MTNRRPVRIMRSSSSSWRFSRRPFRRFSGEWLQSIGALALQEPLLVFAVLSGIAMLLLTAWLTHPGLHVAGATVLLDVVVWKGRARLLPTPFIAGGRIATLALILVVNLLGLLAVALPNDDPFAITLTAFDGIFTLLALLLSPARRRGAGDRGDR